jgi:putative polymerase
MQMSASPSVAASRIGPRLIYAAVLFNMGLCFIGTQGHLHISNAIVATCEIVILGAGLYAIRAQVGPNVLRFTSVLAAYLIGLKLIDSGLDLKILHDLAIAYIFYELGRRADIGQAQRLVWVLMAIIVPIGIFEAAAPGSFGALFDVWTYYVDKGVIAAGTINYTNTTSFISGSRGGQESRMFLAGLLGPGRFSSVFLEPVSMGNFAVIVFAWCLSVPAASRAWRAGLIALAATCVVLSDSRFACGCWGSGCWRCGGRVS